MNLTTTLEIRDELLQFKQSGKKVFAYLTSIGMSNYLLASVADIIYMPTSASTFVRGLRAEIPFYKGMFDKLGITPEFVAIGEYKTAPQIFTMEQMSDELLGELDHKKNSRYVVTRALPKCPPGSPDGYLGTVQQQLLEFFGHYAELLLGMDGLVQEQLNRGTDDE